MTRGFAPRRGCWVLAIAREAGAAVSPVCVEATIRAVMRVAAGEAMATVVGDSRGESTRGGWR